ncbi:MAG TPA: 1,2-phenylacetyl-CoA epoxidase subunit PaaD [Candidatus Limnocylindrales bacterium]|nr:1,2-phenylacetyl-CoA epoxidase subunit PaaD [Candidatus Limnocylindrales bacterium]
MVTAAAAPPLDEAAVRAALAEVSDPEIPVVSIVDLGMVERVEVTAAGIDVELLPTFVGCPALEIIRSAVTERLGAFGRPVRVEFGFRVPWTSDRMSEAGLERLRAAGFAPPVDDPAATRCPHCGSADVALDNLFGPTQCRSLFYCRSCRQPFEGFKSI